MTKTAALSDTQFRTSVTVLAMIALSETGEVSEYAIRTSGSYAHLSALGALVRKGILIQRRAPFVLPAGPYAGQTISETHYSVAG
jgi:hypothetical protein